MYNTKQKKKKIVTNRVIFCFQIIISRYLQRNIKNDRAFLYLLEKKKIKKEITTQILNKVNVQQK